MNHQPEKYILLATRGPHQGCYFGGFNFDSSRPAAFDWVSEETHACLLGFEQVEAMMKRIGPEPGVRPEQAPPPPNLPGMAAARAKLNGRLALTKTQSIAVERGYLEALYV